MSEHLPITGATLLGCSYDIFGLYANPDSVKTDKQMFLLDLHKGKTFKIHDTDSSNTESTYIVPEGMIFKQLKHSEYKTHLHKEIKDTHSYFATRAGLSVGYGLFSAEVSGRYEKEYTTSKYFCQVEEEGFSHIYSLTLDVDQMLDENLLNPNFKKALDNMAPDMLVEEYGTHFLKEGIFGGQWCCSQSVSKLAKTDEYAMKMGVQGKYKGFGGQSETSQKKGQSIENQESDLRFRCRGGDAQALMKGFEEWVKTVYGNYTLVGFSKESLKPISDLVKGNDERKKEIEKAIDKYIKNHDKLKTWGLKCKNSKEIYPYSGKLEQEFTPKKDCVLTGFAGRIDSKDNFTRIAVRVLDLNTGEYSWEVMGDGNPHFNEPDYELIGKVPDGCVMTGIGMNCGKGGNLDSMILHYKELAPINGRNYLGRKEEYQVFERKDKDREQGNERRSKYESYFEPGDNNSFVIVGIGVAAAHEKVDRLRLMGAELTKEED